MNDDVPFWVKLFVFVLILFGFLVFWGLWSFMGFPTHGPRGL